MKNRNCKWRLIGLATGWLFIGTALAVEPTPDTNATVAANVTADANATDANATAAKPRHESVA